MVGGFKTSALNKIWEDTCSVYEYRPQMTENKSTRSEEICVCDNIPCRISYEMMRATRKTEAAAASSVRVKLFCGKEAEIKPGSKIIVNRNGEQLIFKNSGIPAKYSLHQEILLTQFSGWS